MLFTNTFFYGYGYVTAQSLKKGFKDLIIYIYIYIYN